jgi:ornithine carbamoyltransferase
MKDLITLAGLRPGAVAALLGPVPTEPLLAGTTVPVVLPEAAVPDRLAAAAAVVALGGLPLPMTPIDLLGYANDYAGLAAPLSAFARVALVGLPSQRTMQGVADHATVPVLNLGTGSERPLHALADLRLLSAEWGGLAGRRVTYIGLAGAAQQSLAQACALTGVELSVAGPAAGRTLREAVAGTDAVFLGNWTDRSTPALLASARHALLARYRLTAELLALARPGAPVLHEGPCRPGVEVDGRVAGGHRCRLRQQRQALAETLRAAIGTVLQGRSEREPRAAVPASARPPSGEHLNGTGSRVRPFPGDPSA